ncbi:MAG: hypothetical protein EOO96_06615 [Pedobacter sp.]|nr:MAG: hypothetical protein EOO96_06615 [Pedobacter sp.]
MVQSDPSCPDIAAAHAVVIDAFYFFFRRHIDEKQNFNFGKIDEKQFEWLKQKLSEISKDHFICLVSHIPILSICSGLFFNKTEVNGDLIIKRNLMHSDFFELKKLFNEYTNIKTCLSGHIHLQDEVHYHNISYFCNGAISGNWWKGSFQEFDPAYAIFEFYEDGTFKREMKNFG